MEFLMMFSVNVHWIVPHIPSFTSFKQPSENLLPIAMILHSYPLRTSKTLKPKKKVNISMLFSNCLRKYWPFDIPGTELQSGHVECQCGVARHADQRWSWGLGTAGWQMDGLRTRYFLKCEPFPRENVNTRSCCSWFCNVLVVCRPKCQKLFLYIPLCFT